MRELKRTVMIMDSISYVAHSKDEDGKRRIDLGFSFTLELLQERGRTLLYDEIFDCVDQAIMDAAYSKAKDTSQDA